VFKKLEQPTKEKYIMPRNLIRSVLALACLTMVLVPAPVRAQSSSIGLTITLSPNTTTPNGIVSIYGLVTNNSSSRLRATVTLSSLSPCGVETALGYNRLVINPGASTYVTVGYKLQPDACLGVHTITITAGGGKNSASVSASGYLTVQ
jgi:hypothetical protein